MANSTSQLLVRLIDGVSGPAKKAAGALRGISAAAQRINAAQAGVQAAIERNNAALDRARGRLVDATALGYALARSLSAPVKAGVDFQTQLEDIGQKAEIPQEKLAALGARIRKVAADTNQAASQMARGMDVLVGFGASEGDALSLLRPIGRAATAYNAEIEDLSQASYAALLNLKVPADQVATALDAMAQAGKSGAFELRDMARYSPAIFAAYQGLGQKGVPAVADLAAAMQVVRMGAGDSAEAAVNLSNVLQKINAPMTRKAFKKMGVNLEKEMKKAAEAGLAPIEAIAEITNRTLKGDLSKLGDLFQDAQVQKGLRAIIQNMDEYRKIRAEALKAQGVVEEDYQRRLKTTQGFIQRFQATIENLNTSLGAALLPSINDMAERLSGLAARLAEFAEKYPDLTRNVVLAASALISFRVATAAMSWVGLQAKGAILQIANAALGASRGMLTLTASMGQLAIWPVVAAFRSLRTAMVGYTAAAAIGGHGAALSAMASSLLGLLNPIRLVSGALRVMKIALIGTGVGAIAVGIAAAGTWIYNNWNGLSSMFQAFGSAFMRAIEPIKPALQPVIDGVQWLFEKVSNLLGPVDGLGESWFSMGTRAGDALGKMVVALVELPGKVAALAGDMLQAGKTLGKAIFDGVAELVSELAAYIKSKLSDAIASVGSAARSLANKLTFGLVGGGDSPDIPARAGGGPIRAGQPTLVGERGPEIITAGSSGYVHPNDDLQSLLGSGGIKVTIPAINIYDATDARKIAAVLRDEISQALRGIQADYGFKLT